MLVVAVFLLMPASEEWVGR